MNQFQFLFLFDHRNFLYWGSPINGRCTKRLGYDYNDYDDSATIDIHPQLNGFMLSYSHYMFYWDIIKFPSGR